MIGLKEADWAWATVGAKATNAAAMLMVRFMIHAFVVEQASRPGEKRLAVVGVRHTSVPVVGSAGEAESAGRSDPGCLETESPTF